jgi:hypothetical protein
MLKKTGSIDIEANSAWALSSGDSNNGTYTAVITVPTSASPGDYYLFGGLWKDTRGNLVTVETNELGGMSNSGVTVFNSVETDPPVFSNLSVSPSTVDVSSSSQTVTLTLDVTDASGVNIPGTIPNIAKLGSSNINANLAWQRTSGDNKNGSYSATVIVPTTASPGGYYLSSFYWSDIWGNSAISSTPSDGGASNNGLTVINSVTETDPPVFSNLSVSPSTVDVSSSSQTVTLTLDVTDASGVNIPGTIPNIAKLGSSNINANLAWQRTSGDNKNGSYSATVIVPTTASPGGYYLSSFYWSDIWGNSAISSTPSDGGASNNGLTVINSVTETDPPVFSNLSVSPSTVDVSSSSQTVTLTLDVTDASGVNIPGTIPNIAKLGSSNINANLAWQRTSGDNKNGSYSATVIVPTTASPGGYYLSSFYWSDIWGNSAISSTPSAGGASNNGLTVINN